MNYYENPDLEWYKKISAKNKVPPRCPYTMLYTCPIYFGSIALLRNIGATELDKNEEEKLIKYWKDRELNPSLLEETPSMLHHKTKGFSSLNNFCPEVIYLRFGYFASYISNFEDETDQAIRHFDLKKRDITLHSWAWNWSNLRAKHYTDCRLYSILSNEKKIKGSKNNNLTSNNKLIKSLIKLPKETEWVEFKENNSNPRQIGEYISALSNSVCLHHKDCGYLLFGIEDETHKVVGTKFKPKEYKIGNEELENWLLRKLKPQVDFKIIEYVYNDMPVVIFKIDPAYNTPIKFENIAYIRVGTYKKKLSEYPEKERKIWKWTNVSSTNNSNNAK